MIGDSYVITSGRTTFEAGSIVLKFLMFTDEISGALMSESQ